MDRSRGVGWADRSVSRRGPGDDYVLPSRHEAAECLRAALESQAGPVVLTGEPGVGKTWLCRHLRRSMPTCWRWLIVDLSPAVGPTELYQLLLHGMGLTPAVGPAEARAAMTDALEAASADGERWGMIVEECHAAGTSVLEELRVVANRLGDPDALAGVIVTGQTSLTRRLATRPLAALGARVASCVHIRPFTVEEASDWLAEWEPTRVWSAIDVERLHRASGGYPLRIALHSAPRHEPRHVLQSRILRPRREPITSRTPEPAPDPLPVEEPPGLDRPAPILPPGKPPLHVDDEMIEVGWDASSDLPEADDESASAITSATRVPTLAATEEAISDHYAALQAWSEWAQNQGREPVSALASPGDDADAGDDEASGDSADGGEAVPGHPGVRAEGQHAFAPYSQLFSRLRQSHES